MNNNDTQYAEYWASLEEEYLLQLSMNELTK